ncbi:hypothetical protein ABH935_009332, partial [Catenulispora sp. GAS73]|uniref:hypothetical protein n=1 Tax=Catenulispora sp. GAS73 TaxID=3156269 RepID=UPI0035171146
MSTDKAVPEPENGSGADETRRLWRGASLPGRFIQTGLAVAVVIACVAALLPSHRAGVASGLCWFIRQEFEIRVRVFFGGRGGLGRGRVCGV